MRPPSLTICCLAAALVLGTACSRPITVARPAPEARAGRDRETLAQLRGLGRDGDWLVIRGYHATDNLVSLVTNAPFSHAGVLDLELQRVLEADASGVHATPLAEFIAKAHRLLLVRPKWAGQGRGRDALLATRARLGRPYDFSGLVGLNHPERYYCSELAVAGYRPWVRKADHVPPVIPAHELYYWGTVLFDTGSAE
jgi:hypothetical protein